VVAELVFVAVDFAALAAAAWVVVHGASGAADVWPPAVLGGTTTPALEDTPEEPWPSVLAPPVVVLRLISPTDWPTWTAAWRSGGTAARTTPTVNTAMPTASAGRSIASRQSPGRCGARRAGPGARRACPGVA
jgi:hypothetical protein